MKFFSVFIMIAFLFSNCSNNNYKTNQPKSGTLVQISVIDALLQGIYDGLYPIGDLALHGNFGIGTFDALDGELILFNDTVFQVVVSGEVKIPEANVLTPFAAVTIFSADTLFHLNSTSFIDLKVDFNSFFPTPNIFYAVKITGEFKYMKCRSVPKQTKPYPPLVDVTDKQPVFEFKETIGEVIGFYCPEYAKGINVVGMHLHYLNRSRTGGGHVIDFQLKSGTMEIGYLMNYQLLLPHSGDFYGGDFSLDRTADLQKAEN